MVDVFGNEIIKAYTGGTPVKEIYAYGVLVWPTGYYIFWTPMSMSGTFTMEGETYNFEDYSGSFRFSGGVITSSAFQSTSMEWMKTDARSVYNNAFAFCSSMSQAYIESCSVIGANAFTNCTSLEYISAPSCVWVGGNAFESCKFSELYFPLCEDIEGNGFRHCKSLVSIDFPVCSVVKQYAFQDCTSLTTISLPVCKTIEQGAFGGDRNIQSVCLPECSVIGSSAFTYCTSFSYLELMGSSMCQLSGNDQFLNTPFASCEGTIKVPADLINQYLNDSKWMSLSCVLSTDFYIRWTPSNISGIFIIDGVIYNLEDYNGYFTGSNGRRFNGTITDNAFEDTGITTFETNAISFGNYLFNNCKSLKEVTFTLCRSISNNMLGHTDARYSVPFETINLPECTYIESGHLNYISTLTSISLPKCEYIDDNVLYNCSRLSYINLPKCKVLGHMALFGCTRLQSVDLPECESLGRSYSYVQEHYPYLNVGGPFTRCALQSITLPKCKYIGYTAFSSCTNLSVMTLGYSSVVTNGGFSLNQITSSTGSIYVPASLVDVYKSSWKTVKNRIYPIP